MRRLLGLLLAVLLLLATTASAAPVITSISPTEGSEYGGTTVRLHGSGFNNTAEVFVGGARPAAQSWLPLSMELEVLTAPHAPGPVDVTVRQTDGEFTLPCTFTYTKDPFSMTPKSGPREGGTLVTIKGQFDPTAYTVMFGDRAALGTWRVSDDTLLAVSPPQSGPLDAVPIRFFEYDYGVLTNLYFTYQDAPERILLPLLTPPVNGAFGSRYVTDLRAFNRSASQTATISGLSPHCIDTCTSIPDSITIPPGGVIVAGGVAENGSPGRFIFMSKAVAEKLWLNLCVYDSTRRNDNFGTALPVVRDRELFRYEPIVFEDVPTDARFRNTLRVYADAAVKLRLEIARHKFDSVEVGDVEVRELELPAPKSKFDPSYVQVGDLP